MVDDDMCAECGSWVHNHEVGCSLRSTCPECDAPDGWHWVRCSRRAALAEAEWVEASSHPSYWSNGEL